MGMKKSVALMSMFALSGMMSEGTHVHDEFMGRIPTKEEKEEREQRNKKQKEQNRIDKLLKQGCKKFTFKKGIIYARNLKNANRKARNNGWL